MKSVVIGCEGKPTSMTTPTTPSAMPSAAPVVIGSMPNIRATSMEKIGMVVTMIADIAVPMSELVTLPETTTPAEIERAVAQHGYSRYVIVDAEGTPTGYVHLKDVLRAAEGADADMARPIPGKRVHHMVSVLETTDLEDALALMRRSGRHLAQVRDQDGDVRAVLFLEDVIEELVGEVQDATERRRFV